MGKPWKRQKKKRDKAEHGPCFVATCKINGSMIHHCKVCEEVELARKKKREARRARLPEGVARASQELKAGWGERWRRKPKPPFKVQFCGHHVVEANEKIKRHVLLKHPWVIPAWMAAKLLGND